MPVHFMKFGHTACMIEGPPRNWPAGHKWSGTWRHVDCDDCLLGKHMIRTYKISANHKSITCLGCGHKSTEQSSIKDHYCSACYTFHDHLWPPARRAWLKLSKPLVRLQLQLRTNGKWKTTSVIVMQASLGVGLFEELTRRYRAGLPGAVEFTELHKPYV